MTRLTQLFMTLVTLLLLISSLNAQDYAGDDRSICLGECIQLGITEVDGYCYTWGGGAGLNNTNIAQPTACPTAETTCYTVAVTNEMSNLVGLYKVVVSVHFINATLFKPKVLAGNTTTSVDEVDEETLGGQTFVNIDNDDNDGVFDLNDLNVSGNDNELMKLDIISSVENVTIEDPGGVSRIRIWNRENKVGGEYILGSHITLNEIQVNGGSQYMSTLWIEGISASSSQQETVLEFYSSDDITNCTDIISVTILEVSSIEFVGMNNGYAPPVHTSPILDIDPNFPSTAAPLVGRRMFPGARAPQVGMANDKVKIKVSVTPHPIENVSIFIRTFDVDDPSDDIDFIDPNDLGGSADYSGTNIGYDADNDNRGRVNGKSFGELMGQDSDGISSVLILSSSGKGEIQFIASHSPGDNYRMIAYCDKGFLKRIRNKDQLDMFDLVDPSVGAVLFLDKWASEVLTVWRILHMEVESMPNYSWSAGDQQISGNLDDFSSPNDLGTNMTSVNSSVSLVDIGVTGAFDYSLNLDGNGPMMQNGRFEAGELFLGIDALSLPTSSSLSFSGLNLRGNGANKIEFANGNKSLRNIWGILNLSTNMENIFIKQVKKVSPTQYIWTLSPSSVDAMAFNGGTISVGGGLRMPISSTPSSNTVVTSSFRVGFVIRDDDADPSLSLLPAHSDPVAIAAAAAAAISEMNNVYGAAYLICENDIGGITSAGTNTVPMFQSNLEFDDEWLEFEIARDSRINESNEFWVVYAANAWQGWYDGDRDASNEGVVFGQAWSADGLGSVHNIDLAQGWDLCAIYLEGRRDYSTVPLPPSPPRLNYSLTVAHEIGHQFGLGHGSIWDPNLKMYVADPAVLEYPEIGIMADGGNNGNTIWNVFGARHINLIRSRTNSPGE